MSVDQQPLNIRIFLKLKKKYPIHFVTTQIVNPKTISFIPGLGWTGCNGRESPRQQMDSCQMRLSRKL